MLTVSDFFVYSISTGALRACYYQRACSIEAPRGDRYGVLARLLLSGVYRSLRSRWPVALQSTIYGRAVALPLNPLGLLRNRVPNALGVCIFCVPLPPERRQCIALQLQSHKGGHGCFLSLDFLPECLWEDVNLGFFIFLFQSIISYRPV